LEYTLIQSQPKSGHETVGYCSHHPVIHYPVSPFCSEITQIPVHGGGWPATPGFCLGVVPQQKKRKARKNKMKNKRKKQKKEKKLDAGAVFKWPY